MNTFDHDSAPAATDWVRGQGDHLESGLGELGRYPRLDPASDDRKSSFTGIEQLSRLEPDLVLEVFANGQGGDGNRAFRAMDGIIKALGALNAALTPGIGCQVKNLALLENVETHTVIGLLRHSIAVKDPRRKQAFTTYLSRGTVEIVNWLNQLDRDEPLPIARAIQRIAAIAAETGVGDEPHFQSPRTLALLQAAIDLHRARSALAPADKALVSTNGVTVPLVVGPRITESDIEAFAAAWRIQNEVELVLVAKAPDYERTGRWGFLQDGRHIDATIDDSAWLSLFYQRTVDVRPGDAIRVLASVLSLYAADGETISTRYTITAVLELVQPGSRQASVS